MAADPYDALTRAASIAWTQMAREINAASRERANGLVYPIEVIRKTEPRIDYIHRLLSDLLQLGQFTRDGLPIAVDGFKLRSIEHWVERGTAQADEILELLSTRCAVKCEFCYLRMDPEASVTRFNVNRASDMQTDIDMRLDLLARGERLFVPTFQLEEIIGHPGFRRTISRLRAVYDGPISISTTGSLLNEEMLDFIQTLSPIELRISLNAVRPATRAKLMRDQHGVVLAALESMKRRHMRFSVSLVVWPTIEWSEIEETIKLAARCEPYGIFAILPGYTDRFASQEPFDGPTFWHEAVERLARLRHTIDTPLIAHPRMFEEVALDYPPNLPLVIGTITGSPAAKAGLRIGDIIVGVDGFNPLQSRRQAWNLLDLLRAQQVAKVELTVLRGRECLNIRLESAAAAPDYPHGPPFADGFGVVLISQGIAISDLREIARLAKRRKAKRVGLATSSVVAPSLSALLADWRPILFPDVEIVPFIPANRFYGGNIVLGELNTASDLLVAINELLKHDPTIDLVVVPSPAFGPGGWWRDLEGVAFQRLARASPCPVELLVCSSFE